MAANKDTILSWLADLCAAIVTDADDLADTADRIVAAADLDAQAFAPQALDIMRVISESVTDATAFDMIIIPGTVSVGDTFDAMTILVALGLSIAGGRVDWRSRPQARNARARISSAGDAGLAVASAMGGDGADLYSWLSAVVEVACRLVSDLAANAVPIVRVQTGISLPSTVLAYQLYGDAARAGDLVDIAGSATPLVMPTAFDALAS
ncbi:hypothetical protein [Rhizobium sp. CNPSo 4039]|uniref:hypothetical protein n=1 Tax=Rhizobium sp. CNPSo 4039 TaxID=3021409 RepID=UPI00254DAB66|nr:hypothetical protein [Rhizobium sp. CNPSo 4039]MDK4712987.1 hypothetical protein [Rhizobium sp. CNPSo 4039]